MPPSIELAPRAEDNGLASMLADLVRQNLEAKPHKQGDFRALAGSIAIVADDADVALTLRFDHGRLTIHDGIVGIPDVTIRGDSDTIMALSNIPLLGKFGLPLPDPRDKKAVAVARGVMDAMRKGSFHVYGMFFHLPMLMRLTRVMSVNG
jgi:SCP-2 sterol transfer family